MQPEPESASSNFGAGNANHAAKRGWLPRGLFTATSRVQTSSHRAPRVRLNTSHDVGQLSKATSDDEFLHVQVGSLTLAEVFVACHLLSLLKDYILLS